MFNKRAFLISNIILFCLSLFMIIALNMNYKREYEDIFLSHIGYSSSNQYNIEDYTNFFVGKHDDYHQLGESLIKESTYQKSYKEFLSNKLEQYYYQNLIIFLSFYILITIGMYILYKNNMKTEEIIIKNIDQYDSKSLLSNKLHITLQKHHQYIQYQVDKINQEKEFMYRFVMYITHQLKTPLAVLRLMVENQSCLYHFESSKIELQIDKISHTISELLNQGKLESGRIEMKIEKNELDILVQDILEDLEELINHKNIIMQFHYHNALVYYDAYWMKEALCNIIKNCIEHSQNNQRVDVYVEVGQELVIKICDYAGGIKDIQHIFERYYSSNEYTGVGIGLYLSSLIVSKHFGEIKAYNSDKGACFQITIPNQFIM